MNARQRRMRTRLESGVAGKPRPQSPRALVHKAKAPPDRIKKSVLCVAVLADSKDQINEELTKAGFRNASEKWANAKTDKLVFTGYLGLLMEKLGSPVNKKGDNAWVADIEKELPEKTLIRGDVRAWFTKIIIEERWCLCIAGDKEQITALLESFVPKWRTADFNPGGVTTDLEYALNFLKSKPAAPST